MFRMRSKVEFTSGSGQSDQTTKPPGQVNVPPRGMLAIAGNAVLINGFPGSRFPILAPLLITEERLAQIDSHRDHDERAGNPERDL